MADVESIKKQLLDALSGLKNLNETQRLDVVTAFKNVLSDIDTNNSLSVSPSLTTASSKSITEGLTSCITKCDIVSKEKSADGKECFHTQEPLNVLRSTCIPNVDTVSLKYLLRMHDLQDKSFDNIANVAMDLQNNVEQNNFVAQPGSPESLDAYPFNQSAWNIREDLIVTPTPSLGVAEDDRAGVKVLELSCPLCHLKFSHWATTEHHLYTEHASTVSPVCKRCQGIFANQALLLAHECFVWGRTHLPCESILSESTTKQHLSRNNEELGFPRQGIFLRRRCGLCFKSTVVYSSHEMFENHKNTIHSSLRPVKGYPYLSSFTGSSRGRRAHVKTEPSDPKISVPSDSEHPNSVGALHIAVQCLFDRLLRRTANANDDESLGVIDRSSTTDQLESTEPIVSASQATSNIWNPSSLMTSLLAAQRAHRSLRLASRSARKKDYPNLIDSGDFAGNSDMAINEANDSDRTSRVLSPNTSFSPSNSFLDEMNDSLTARPTAQSRKGFRTVRKLKRNSITSTDLDECMSSDCYSSDTDSYKDFTSSHHKPTGSRHYVCRCCPAVFRLASRLRAHYLFQHGTVPVSLGGGGLSDAVNESGAGCSQNVSKPASRSRTTSRTVTSGRRSKRKMKRPRKKTYRVKCLTTRANGESETRTVLKIKYSYNWSDRVSRVTSDPKSTPASDSSQITPEPNSTVQSSDSPVPANRSASVSNFECEHCGRLYKSSYTLNSHVDQVHRQQYRLFCGYCEFRTNDRSAFDEHLARHFRIKLFVCPHCDTRFVARRDLNDHIAFKHGASRNFRCPDCDQTFKTAGTLSRHRTIHKQHRLLHRCLLCHMDFTRLSNLKRHMTRAHRGDESSWTSNAESNQPIKNCKQPRPSSNRGRRPSKRTIVTNPQSDFSVTDVQPASTVQTLENSVELITDGQNESYRTATDELPEMLEEFNPESIVELGESTVSLYTLPPISCIDSLHSVSNSAHSPGVFQVTAQPNNCLREPAAVMMLSISDLNCSGNLFESAERPSDSICEPYAVSEDSLKADQFDTYRPVDGTDDGISVQSTSTIYSNNAFSSLFPLHLTNHVLSESVLQSTSSDHSNWSATSQHLVEPSLCYLITTATEPTFNCDASLGQDTSRILDRQPQQQQHTNQTHLSPLLHVDASNLKHVHSIDSLALTHQESKHDNTCVANTLSSPGTSSMKDNTVIWRPIDALDTLENENVLQSNQLTHTITSGDNKFNVLTDFHLDDSGHQSVSTIVDHHQSLPYSFSSGHLLDSEKTDQPYCSPRFPSPVSGRLSPSGIYSPNPQTVPQMTYTTYYTEELNKHLNANHADTTSQHFTTSEHTTSLFGSIVNDSVSCSSIPDSNESVNSVTTLDHTDSTYWVDSSQATPFDVIYSYSNQPVMCHATPPILCVSVPTTQHQSTCLSASHSSHSVHQQHHHLPAIMDQCANFSVGYLIGRERITSDISSSSYHISSVSHQPTDNNNNNMSVGFRMPFQPPPRI